MSTLLGHETCQKRKRRGTAGFTESKQGYSSYAVFVIQACPSPLLYSKFRSKILRRTKKTPRKAACTSIPSFFIANIFLLNDREPQVGDLGKDGGGRVSPAIKSMQQGLH